MKAVYKVLLMVFFAHVATGIQPALAHSETKTETFKVSGNCGMCKDRIEGALKKKDGIVNKSWDEETKMITVSYNPEKISLTQIRQKIADAGYDTDEIKASDEAYSKLHGCCKYERTK